jgi:hypothetical protein
MLSVNVTRREIAFPSDLLNGLFLVGLAGPKPA